MPERSKADVWTQAILDRIAREHFPSRARSLGEIVRQLAQRHETAWRSSSAGVFRPTTAMYALGLLWQLEELGPTCAFCNGTVEVPRQSAPSGPSGPSLALRLRTPADRGGLNIPQNLALCHARCVRSQS